MAVTSIVCPKCIPEEYRGRRGLRGYWDADSEAKIAKCTNCGYERPFHSRRRSNEINPSQQKALDRIQAFFDERRYRDEPKKLTRFEVRTTDYGIVWLSVETSDHPLTMQGGHFQIGPRGAIKVCSVYEISEDKRATARHYAKMLHGKVDKYF